ncbi:MAG: cytochrome c oxidase subunit I, partial [Actinobacteria bacterium]|nr:cytochrome c oxidase subunit I [Actinomycetota bacterium]
ALALVFFVVAGLEALLIRVQLFGPNGTVLTASQYNQVFTMHGTTMVFLVGMPMAVAFGNYLVPLQIGARDVAFPRINAFGFWIVLLGGIFIYSSFFLGGAPDGGWFGYTPLTSSPMSSGFLPGRGPDFWAIGLIFLGIGSTTSAVNFIVTILNMRAPGMTLMRMPVFVWMIFVIAFLTLFAMPIITVALIMVYTDRHFATNFFFAPKGGDPLLYQHLFWLFGHPEVYILILPGMGIVSEVLPVFARKPLFGRAVVIFSGIAIGFLGWSVWAHHMFTTGLGPVAVSAFSLATMLIAIPTGVKIFNWLGTVFKGSIRLTTAMLFSLGFIVMFTIGGVSGVLHSVVPGDTQQTDTYFVVAHFHYVLFGGLILAIFSGFYFWFPKFFGRMLNERIGKINFWTMLIGFNLTFFPMHLLGLYGQPRRTYRYDTGMGWTGLNQIVSIGSFLVAFSVLIFLVNVIFSLVAKRGAVAGNDPWDARTLEWSISSPPPAYNFAEIPQVSGPDGFWDQKYTEDDQGRLLAIPSGGSAPAKPESDGSGIHLPSPSIYPLVVAIGILPIAYGAVFENLIMVGAGVLVMLFGMYAWAIEPSTEEH